MSTLAFQSHVPKILVAQIHDQISKKTDEGFEKIYTIQPQIRYFECALLFLDISGFTALSAAVSPEVLKNSINGYFSSIIEVVDKYHGDVIKFAGDALFVIWRRDPDDASDSLQKCVESAVMCATEINVKCNNREVSVDSTPDWSSMRSAGNIFAIKEDQNASSSLKYFLNVHSGVSVGAIGGVDVGHMERWEYFLIGDPVEEVGDAADQAPAGTVVISGSAARLLQDEDDVDHNTAADGKQNIAMRWTLTPVQEGCFVVTTTDFENWSVDAPHFVEQQLNMGNGIESDTSLHSLESAILFHVHQTARHAPVNQHSTPQQAQRKLIKPVSTSRISEGEPVQAELRTVVTLFIKVIVELGNGETVEVTGDAGDSLLPSPASVLKTGGGKFLARSVEQELQDAAIVDKLQKCMEVFVSSFHEHGGQLRQFILDDKGCVCIGTYGLRKSVTKDNCGAAVKSAQAILHGLEKLGVRAGIGITLGRAFCGLVGSASRHEYGVMGPSVNLSARLMVAAPLGSILCDESTKNADNTHSYVALREIKAKGYSRLVATYRPVEFIEYRRPKTTDVDDSSFYLSPQLAARASAKDSSTWSFAGQEFVGEKDRYFARLGCLREVESFLRGANGDCGSGPGGEEEHRSRLVELIGRHGMGRSAFLNTFCR